ncbi:uncharacterized protein LODBEIA_P23630 [Lodderomyces beijingensis]|uniref:D-lactate dehydratase n=1 Tax=Lodderomyces beijingensis TaxID=1775926 RepID=A0ABP0ZJ21_9ASCO
MVKVLIALTSYNQPFFPNGDRTGVFIIEALAPFLEFTNKGYEVVFASENGLFGYDAASFAVDFLSGENKQIFDDPNSPFSKAINSTRKASEVVDEKFDIFYASAGHGTLFDYPHATSLHKIATQVWQDGGVVSAICHGPAIFLNWNDPKTGEPFIKGKKITGFTVLGEDLLGVTSKLQTDSLPTVSEIAKREGAEYVEPPGPWAAFTVTDGKLVTGVNPQTAEKIGKAIIEAYEA